MRRKFYLGFGVILLAIFLILLMLHDSMWFLLIAIPLALIFIYDLVQTKHSILRNFPILGHIRFILEFFGPEIRQYFIAHDDEERPFDRETRTIIYERAKNIRDTVPFGTERDILKVGYVWAQHSLAPKHMDDVEKRVLIGGPDCKQPYSASHLNISAMSFGALSANAILALNKGAALGNFYHNTGEGGLSHHHLAGGGDIVWQLGTAYFGCRHEDGSFDEESFKEKAQHEQVKMIEIKLSQGAKPSHGGILPAAKVTPEIAKIRKIKLGQDVISPPAHPEFSTPKGLLNFVKKLRKLSNGKPIGFKLNIGKYSEFLGICKAMVETQIYPDFITVDGAEGGTGAAPLEFSNHLGMPLNMGLVFVHNALMGVNLRDKIKIICSGKITTGFDMVSKIALGADLCNTARAMMLSVGCIQSRQCNTNGCPTGVATQNKRLMRALSVEDKKFRVKNYHDNTVKSFLELIGAMGLTSSDDLTPEHILKRVAQNDVKNYAELYDYLKPGVLLNETKLKKLSANWTKAWASAKAGSF